MSSSLVSSSSKRSRSSARSIASAEVPRIGTPARCERHGELERRLAAELHDHAVGLLRSHDVQHVLERQRLEVQLVRRVVVGRDRLRVAVDHDRLVARLAQGERGVHAAVVELDPLADAVGTAAEDHDLLALAARASLSLPGGVDVGRVAPRTRRRRCRRACRPARDRAPPLRADVRRAARPSAAICCRRTRAPWPRAAAPRDRLARRRAALLELDDLAHLSRNHGSMSVASWMSSTVSPTRRRRARAATGVRMAETRSSASIGVESRSSLAVRRRAPGRMPSSPRREHARLQRPHGLLQRLLERAPDRHRLADRLHLRRERRSAPGTSRRRSAGSS